MLVVGRTGFRGFVGKLARFQLSALDVTKLAAKPPMQKLPLLFFICFSQQAFEFRMMILKLRSPFA